MDKFIGCLFVFTLFALCSCTEPSVTDSQVLDPMYIYEKEYIEPEPEPEPELEEVAEVNEEPELLDPWRVILDWVEYQLEGMPLYKYSEVVAKACWESGMDPYWFCTIAIHESSGGAYCFRPYNAWGWMAGDWSSWEESIPAYCEAFVSLYGSGLTIENHLTYDPGGSYAIYF